MIKLTGKQVVQIYVVIWKIRITLGPGSMARRWPQAAESIPTFAQVPAVSAPAPVPGRLAVRHLLHHLLWSGLAGRHSLLHCVSRSWPPFGRWRPAQVVCESRRPPASLPHHCSWTAGSPQPPPSAPSHDPRCRGATLAWSRCTAVPSKGMCLMGKLHFKPNCVEILPILSSGYQMLAIVEMFNVGESWGYSFK